MTATTTATRSADGIDARTDDPAVRARRRQRRPGNGDRDWHGGPDGPDERDWHGGHGGDRR